MYIIYIQPPASVLPFSKSNIRFFGFFDPKNILLDDVKKYLQGDLTDISALKQTTGHCGLTGMKPQESLIMSTAVVSGRHFWLFNPLWAAEYLL